MARRQCCVVDVTGLDHTRSTAELRHFFFHAEGGIRDTSVTGVQTCALPISGGRRVTAGSAARPEKLLRRARRRRRSRQSGRGPARRARVGGQRKAPLREGGARLLFLQPPDRKSVV